MAINRNKSGFIKPEITENVKKLRELNDILSLQIKTPEGEPVLDEIKTEETVATLKEWIELIKTRLAYVEAMVSDTVYMFAKAAIVHFNNLNIPYVEKERHIEVNKSLLDCVYKTYNRGITQQNISKLDLIADNNSFTEFDSKIKDFLVVQNINYFGLIISKIVQIMLLELANFIRSFADGIGMIRMNTSIWLLFFCFNICIDIGTPIRLIIYRWLYYYICYGAYKMEEVPWCFVEVDSLATTGNTFVDIIETTIDVTFFGSKSGVVKPLSIPKGTSFIVDDKHGTNLKFTLKTDYILDYEKLEIHYKAANNGKLSNLMVLKDYKLTLSADLLLNNVTFESYPKDHKLTKIILTPVPSDKSNTTSAVVYDGNKCTQGKTQYIADDGNYKIDNQSYIIKSASLTRVVYGKVKINAYRMSVGSIQDSWFLAIFNEHSTMKATSTQQSWVNFMRFTDGWWVLSYLLRLGLGGCKDVCAKLNFNISCPTIPNKYETPNFIKKVLIPDLENKNDEIIDYCSNCLTLNCEYEIENLTNLDIGWLKDQFDGISANQISAGTDSYTSSLEDAKNAIFEAETFINLSEVQENNFSILTGNKIPTAVQNDTLEGFAKIETALREIDKLLTGINNMDYIDIINKFEDINTGTRSMSSKVQQELLDKLDIKKKTLEDNIKIEENLSNGYRNSILSIDFQIEEIEMNENSVYAYKSKEYNNERRSLIASKKKVDNKIEVLRRELLRVERSIKKAQDNMSNKTSNYDKTKMTKKMKTIFVFILDLICCLMSLIFLLLTHEDVNLIIKSKEDFAKIHKNTIFEILTGKYKDTDSYIYKDIVKIKESLQILGLSVDAIINLIFFLMSLKDETSIDGDLQSNFSLDNPKTAFTKLGTNIAFQIVNEVVYTATKEIMALLNKGIESLNNMSDVEGLTPRILKLLFEGKCASLMYGFNYLISMGVSYQRYIATLCYLMQSEYSFSANLNLSVTIDYKSNYTNITTSLFDFILKNLDFLIKFCNLTDEAERVSAMSELIDRLLAENADLFKEVTPETAQQAPAVFDVYDESTDVDIRNGKISIDEYIQEIVKAELGIGLITNTPTFDDNLILNVLESKLKDLTPKADETESVLKS